MIVCLVIIPLTHYYECHLFGIPPILAKGCGIFLLKKRGLSFSKEEFHPVYLSELPFCPRP